MSVTNDTPNAILRAFVNASAIGNTQVVAAQGAGKIILVLAVLSVSDSTAVSVKFQSSITDISPAWPVGANGGFVAPFNEVGWFQSNANEALNVNLSAAINTGVLVLYRVV